MKKKKLKLKKVTVAHLDRNELESINGGGYESIFAYTCFETKCGSCPAEETG